MYKVVKQNKDSYNHVFTINDYLKKTHTVVFKVKLKVIKD